MEKINILLELTRKCNLFCKHCYNSSNVSSPLQLTIREVEILINDIKNIEKRHPIERIILTGGEFLTMDNSLEIYNMFRRAFCCVIRIETNGFLFFKDKTLFKKYDADEFFISIDKFHKTLNLDGTSDILECFLKNTNKNIIARVTIEPGMESLRDAFISKYKDNKNLKIEAKYVSPSGRAENNLENFKGFKFKDNPDLFKCLAKNFIHFNVERNWYCCYTACRLSYFAKLGDNNIIEKFENKYLSRKMCAIREKGIIELLNKDAKKKFENQKFYYRCEPCLFLQRLNFKKIILVDLPAVDTAQDVYTKGFIFPTFTQKYLKKILEMNDITVYYYNLNNINIKKAIEEINELGAPVYIHLIANKYYSYKIFKKLVKNKLLVGGPLPKFDKKTFNDVTIIDDELEEDGILKYFNIENKNIWNSPVFCPNKIDSNFENKTVKKDFSNIILLSRGCLYKCAFCIHSCYHKQVHVRNIQSIELELNNYRNQNTSIYIADASIGNLRLYNDILNLLSKYKNIKFSMNIRADQINDNTIEKLKNINIDRLYIGVESVNDLELKKYNKGETSNKILEGLELLRKNNINYHLSFIISEGLSNENIKELDKIYKAKTYSFHYYIPYPGTFKYNSIEYFDDKNWPQKIFDNNLDIKKLKVKISKYFNYPINNYHTITPHNHINTFKIISKKLEELESCVLNENNK